MRINWSQLIFTAAGRHEKYNIANHSVPVTATAAGRKMFSIRFSYGVRHISLYIVFIMDVQ